MKHLSIILVALFFAACGGDDSSDSGDGVVQVVAVGSDYVGNSVVSTILMPELDLNVAAVDGVASLDPIIRRRGDYLVVVNRSGFDNLTVLAADDLTLVAQVSTGVGTNPQDVALVGNRLYAATAAGTGLVVIDLDDTAAGAVAIDLSSLDPDDGIPNCHAVEAVGTDVVVSCAIRDDNSEFLTPRGAGIIAVVDSTTNVLTSQSTLEHASPTGFFASSGSDLYLGTVPDFFQPGSDGCIETISGTQAVGCLIDNQELGGYAADLSGTDTGLFAAVVSGFDADDFAALGSAYDIDLGASTPSAVAFEGSADVRAFDVAVCPSGERVISAATAGLRIYAADGTELSSGPLDIGAPVIQGGTECL